MNNGAPSHLDLCECGGRFTAYKGRDGKALRVLYICCNRCRAKPLISKLYVPLDQVIRRRKRCT
jgi:hypothetical protein